MCVDQQEDAFGSPCTWILEWYKKSMSLKYEPASEPLHISVKYVYSFWWTGFHEHVFLIVVWREMRFSNVPVRTRETGIHHRRAEKFSTKTIVYIESASTLFTGSSFFRRHSWPPCISPHGGQVWAAVAASDRWFERTGCVWLKRAGCIPFRSSRSFISSSLWTP